LLAAPPQPTFRPLAGPSVPRMMDDAASSSSRGRSGRGSIGRRKRTDDSDAEPVQGSSSSAGYTDEEESEEDVKPQPSSSKPRQRKPAKSRARAPSLGPDGQPKPPILDKDGVPLSTRQVSMLNRQSIACFACRMRKGKCDGARPTCQACASRGTECVYAEKPRRRGPARGPSKASGRKRTKSEPEPEAAPVAAEEEVDEGPPVLPPHLPPLVGHPLPLPALPTLMPAPFQTADTPSWSTPVPGPTLPPMMRMQLSAERRGNVTSDGSVSRGSGSPAVSPGVDTLPRTSWLPPAPPRSIAEQLQADAAASSANEESTSQLTPSFFPTPPQGD